MTTTKASPNKDAYQLILQAIERGQYEPGDPLVENELADRFGVSRTPVREALQRLESQQILRRDGRSMVVASLDYEQLAELYTVRAELEALAAKLAAKHADRAEIDMLFELIERDREYLDDPGKLAQTNKRFHKQIHLASHNRYLQQNLEMVHRSMALMARTSLAAEGRPEEALSEHLTIAEAIASGDGESAAMALRDHLHEAFKTRLRAMEDE